MLPHLWETDPRDPLVTFFLPASMVGDNYQGTYGFYMLSLSFWMELLLVSKGINCSFIHPSIRAIIVSLLDVAPVS
jgi:hypothetical protein